MCETKEPLWDEFLEIEDLTVFRDNPGCDDRDSLDVCQIDEYDVFNPPDSDPYP